MRGVGSPEIRGGAMHLKPMSATVLFVVQSAEVSPVQQACRQAGLHASLRAMSFAILRRRKSSPGRKTAVQSPRGEYRLAGGMLVRESPALKSSHFWGRGSRAPQETAGCAICWLNMASMAARLAGATVQV